MTGSGVEAIIGDVDEQNTKVAALLASTVGVPHCSGASDEENLSTPSLLSYFFRTILPESYYGARMVDLVAALGWNRIAVIYSNEVTGQICNDRDENVCACA